MSYLDNKGLEYFWRQLKNSALKDIVDKEIQKEIQRNGKYEIAKSVNAYAVGDIINFTDSVRNYEFLIFRVGLSNIELGASYYTMIVSEISIGAIFRIPISNDLYLIIRFNSFEEAEVVGSNIPSGKSTYGVRGVYGYIKSKI